MKAWFEDRGVVLPAVPPAFPALKPAATAQDERILGDGSGNGAVTWWDLWYFWHHLTGGYDDFSLDLDLLDIDRNGKTDWVDLGLLGDYLFGTGSNPHGIGQPLSSSITASLSPDPTGFDFKDDGIWHRFTVNVRTASGAISDARVWVVVNATTEADLALEIASGARAPVTTFCPGERDDTRKNLGDGAVVWISGCQEGASNILVADNKHDHELLTSYEIEVLRAVEPSIDAVETSFNIELVFVGTAFNSTQRALVRDAADQWEAVITNDIRDQQDANFDSRDHDATGWWSSFKGRLLGGHLATRDRIDDLRVYVAAHRDDVSQAGGVGGNFWVRGDSRLPILGFIGIHQDAILANPNNQDIIYSMALHEIGHALGFGNIWEEPEINVLRLPSRANPFADTHFSGVNAIAAFNAAGGWNYQGNKVPVETGGDDSHWRESVFGEELMSPVLAYGNIHEPMSEVTIQAMTDIGYVVDVTLAEPYSLPPASKPVATAPRRSWCRVPPLPPKELW